VTICSRQVCPRLGLTGSLVPTGSRNHLELGELVPWFPDLSQEPEPTPDLGTEPDESKGCEGQISDDGLVCASDGSSSRGPRQAHPVGATGVHPPSDSGKAPRVKHLRRSPTRTKTQPVSSADLRPTKRPVPAPRRGSDRSLPGPTCAGIDAPRRNVAGRCANRTNAPAIGGTPGRVLPGKIDAKTAGVACSAGHTVNRSRNHGSANFA
jgi:hypothetical protein